MGSVRNSYKMLVPKLKARYHWVCRIDESVILKWIRKKKVWKCRLDIMG
jgi:hypothetical protein